jgi:hypothetical protein
MQDVQSISSAWWKDNIFVVGVAENSRQAAAFFFP